MNCSMSIGLLQCAHGSGVAVDVAQARPAVFDYSAGFNAAHRFVAYFTDTRFRRMTGGKQTGRAKGDAMTPDQFKEILMYLKAGG